MDSVWSQFTHVFVSFMNNFLSPVRDTEAAATAVEALSAKITDWASCLMGLYFTSAIAIAVVSLQVQTELPLIFHFLYLAIVIGFSSLLFAEFVYFKSPVTTQILRCLSLFSMVFAFFAAVSVPFPLYFKLISFIVFVAAFFLVFWFAIIPTT